MKSKVHQATEYIKNRNNPNAPMSKHDLDELEKISRAANEPEKIMIGRLMDNIEFTDEEIDKVRKGSKY